MILTTSHYTKIPSYRKLSSNKQKFAEQHENILSKIKVGNKENFLSTANC